MFSKAVLTVKDLVMPTGLRQATLMKIGVAKSSTVAGQTTCNNIDRSRTQNVRKIESPRFDRRMVNAIYYYTNMNNLFFVA